MKKIWLIMKSRDSRTWKMNLSTNKSNFCRDKREEKSIDLNKRLIKLNKWNKNWKLLNLLLVLKLLFVIDFPNNYKKWNQKLLLRMFKKLKLNNSLPKMDLCMFRAKERDMQRNLMEFNLVERRRRREEERKNKRKKLYMMRIVNLIMILTL